MTTEGPVGDLPDESARLQRHASIIRLRPEHEQRYRELHADVWPQIRAMLTSCNIRNYSIYLYEGHLFSYFEYVGSDFDGDVAVMAADPDNGRWLDIIQPMQQPVTEAPSGVWWMPMTEVFHLD